MSMQVNGNPATPINWETLLSPLGDVKKADSVDGKTSFTITTKVGDETKTTTISIPDDLDLPETVNQGTLNDLVDKLAATGLGFTDEQIATMKDAIAKLYGDTATAIDQVNKASKGSVLFDLYALMALMIEVAQSQRDAAREMRTSQNLAIQQSIQNQADQQREAARVGMIVGIICGAVSALASGALMFGQSRVASNQSKLMAQSGTDSAQMHLSSLKNVDSTATAQAKLDQVSAKVGNEVAGRVNNEFGNRLVDDQAGNLHDNFTNAKANLDTKQQALDTAKGELQTANNTLAEKTAAKNDAQARVDTLSEKIDVYWEKSQYVKAQGEQADPAKIAEFNQRLGDNFNINQAHQELEAAQADLAHANTELATAQRDVQIKGDAVTRATAELETAKTDFAKAKDDYVKTVKDIAADYQDKYQSAVDKLANPPPGADKAQLKANVKTAKAEMEMAFAKEAKLLSEDGAMTVAEQKDMIAGARLRLDTTNDRLMQRSDFKSAERRMSMLMGINNINQALGGVAQSAVSNWSATISSEATRQGAETQREEEMLDQTKDLFQQEQKLIDQVVQLFTAVIQAESQSMRDAIQA